jgi:hypothetical protein
MQSTMMNAPLSLNHLLERAGRLFAGNEIVSRRPDKSLVRHSYGAFYRRTRALASALQGLGLRKGDRVATLCWNHHAHLECYFGIPAAGGVMHTLNLRLAPEEIGWIAGDAQDRFLVIDDVLLPLYEQFKHRHAFEQVIVFPFSGGQPAPEGLLDYEALLAGAENLLRIHRRAALQVANDAASEPISRFQPSASTNSISLKGRATSTGLSIIMPRLISTLATIMSMIRKGTKIMKPIWNALFSSLVTNAGTSTEIGTSSACVPSATLPRRENSCRSLWRVFLSMNSRSGSRPVRRACSAGIWPALYGAQACW